MSTHIHPLLPHLLRQLTFVHQLGDRAGDRVLAEDFVSFLFR